jgi:hypothetical protein
VSIFKSKTNIGQAVKLIFRITQNERDLNLMLRPLCYLGAGILERYYRYSIVSLTVVKLADINKKIIPFFKSSPE